MSDAFCRKIFKGVALAGAGVALGAAVVSFSLKRVSAASRRSLHDVSDEEEKKKKKAASASPSNTPASSATTQQQSSAAAAVTTTPSSAFGGSSSSLASIKSGRRHPNASSKSLSRHPSASSTSGLSRNGSSSWDLHGSAASLVSSEADLDSDGGSLGGGGGSGPSSLEYHPSSDQRPAKWNYNWDLRDPSFTNRARPKFTRHLFFILHGHYISNGETNLHFLSSLGKTQLELTGKRLVTLGLPFSRIFHSSALRCKQSVCILRGHLPSMETVQDDLLLECAAESVSSNQRQMEHRETASSASAFYEDGARIEAAFRKYLHRAELNQKSDSYEVIVTHANVIRYFVCRALQLPPEAWLRMSLHNGSITWLSIRPDGLVFVRELGDTGHMPANDELKNADGSLILTKMPSKMQSWYLHEATTNSSEDDYLGTVQL